MWMGDALCAEGSVRPRASREAPAREGGRALPGVAAGREKSIEVAKFNL